MAFDFSEVNTDISIPSYKFSFYALKSQLIEYLGENFCLSLILGLN